MTTKCVSQIQGSRTVSKYTSRHTLVIFSIPNHIKKLCPTHGNLQNYSKTWKLIKIWHRKLLTSHAPSQPRTRFPLTPALSLARDLGQSKQAPAFACELQIILQTWRHLSSHLSSPFYLSFCLSYLFCLSPLSNWLQHAASGLNCDATCCLFKFTLARRALKSHTCGYIYMKCGYACSQIGIGWPRMQCQSNTVITRHSRHESCKLQNDSTKFCNYRIIPDTSDSASISFKGRAPSVALFPKQWTMGNSTMNLAIVIASHEHLRM